MTGCLAPQEIARYRAGDLKTEEELLAIEEHLDGCAACRRSLNAALSLAAPALLERLTSPVEISACMEPALLARYVEGRADATDIELVRTHCEDCSRCAQDLADRLAARETTAPTATAQPRSAPTTSAPETAAPTDSPAPAASLPSWRQRLRSLLFPNGSQAYPAFAVSVLVLVAILGALAVYRGSVLPLNRSNQALQQQRETLRTQVMVDITERAELERRLAQSDRLRTEQEARLQQRDRRIQELEAHLSHLPTVPSLHTSAPLVAMVEQAMATHRTDLAPEPRRLIALMQTEASGVRSGSSDPTGSALLQPVGTLVLEDRPILTWKATPGVQNYTVTLSRVPDAHDAAPNEEQHSSPLTGTSWRVDRALQPGKRYQWQVVAQPGDVVSAIGQFVVVDVKTAQTLRQASQEYSSQPLTLGILYARFGLLDAAETALKAVPQSDPRSSVAQSLLQNIHSMRASSTRSPGHRGE